MAAPGAVKVLFASCPNDRVADFAREFGSILPEIPAVIVSEFPRHEAEWIPWHVQRPFSENLDLIRERLAGRNVRISATVLMPKTAPAYFWLRLAAFRLAPRRFLAFNENLDHFMLRPGSAPVIARHAWWRAKTLTVTQVSPGGELYTWLWRMRHPHRWRRSAHNRLAIAAGQMTAALKRVGTTAPNPVLQTELPPGVSVVIPSRNGRELLARLLFSLLPQLDRASSEVIVVDNGSDDGSAGFLEREFPNVTVDVSVAALSFSIAVNRGAARARFSHLLLLNNDMEVKPEFIGSLRSAFDDVPDLFCATAQIFPPSGHPREETGKSAWRETHGPTDFPIRSDPPVQGENHSYVLYGSGGCSLYATPKWRALSGMCDLFHPAYVEDLDLGFRAWRLGWPSIYVDGARVLHHHRSTTSRYFDEHSLQFLLERNLLRFLAHAVTDPDLFGALWKESIARINVRASRDEEEHLIGILSAARLAPGWIRPHPPAVIPERDILAIGSGDISVFAGRAPSGKPAVLVVSPYAPFPLSHGGAVRMFNLMSRAARDYDQILITFVDHLHTPPPELLDICAEIVYVRRIGSHANPDKGRPEVVEDFDRASFHAALKQTVRKWRPAIAQLEFTQMAQYAADCAPARTLLVEHDITLNLYHQLSQQRDDWEIRRQYERWVRFEQAAWGQVDRIVTLSDKDRRAVGRPNAVTIANGVDTRRFRPTSREPDPRRILFIGSFAHLPNVLAIDWFLREVWHHLDPLNPTLHVIAGNRREYYLDRYNDRARPELHQPRIELEGFVADVRPAYERATVVVAPLLASAGTNIKIMEALAMGKPVVSTPAGINGLHELRPGADVVVVSDPLDMAAVIAALIADPETRRELSREARRTAERIYDWNVIGEVQRSVYEPLITGQ